MQSVSRGRSFYQLLALLLAGVAFVLGSLAAGLIRADDAGPAVRHLEIDGEGLLRTMDFPEPGVRVIDSAEAARRALSEPVLERVAREVDFDRESLALVLWQTGGPPFGELKHELKEDGDAPSVVFYVLEPDVPIRGRALRHGLDLFAVPRGAEVRYGGQVQPGAAPRQ